MDTEEKIAEIAARVDEDPILVNELNQEAWWQSGIMWWGSGGVLWALGAIGLQIVTHGSNLFAYDVNVMMTAGGALLSAGMVLYRRFWPNLPPLFAGN